jgi:hypothetical protein
VPFPTRVASSLTVVSILSLAACGLDSGGSLDTSGDDASTGADVGSPDAVTSSDGASNADGTAADAPADAIGSDATAVDANADGSPLPDAGLDSAIPDASPPDSAPDSSPTCTIASGCYVVPGGWTLVAVDSTQPAASCPSGWDSANPIDLVEGPNATNGCACAQCSTTTQPTCDSGAVKVFYDLGIGGNMTCGLAGMPATMSNNPAGSCLKDLYTMGLPPDLEFVSPPPSGGACTSAGQQQKQNVTYSGQARECQPNSASSAGCTGNQCRPQLASPYAACIAHDGTQQCPSPYTTRHLVGTDVNYTCANCSCSVTSACGAGTVTLFSDDRCSMGATPFVADGMCHATMTNASFHSYKFAGGSVSNVACAAGAAPAGQNVQLVMPQTICCAP